MRTCKRWLPLIVAVLLVALFSSAANADNVLRFKTARTGGGASALDGIDGSILVDGDITEVTESTQVSTYVLDADSGETDDGDAVIAPDANAGTKRWIRKGRAPKYPLAENKKTCLPAVSSGCDINDFCRLLSIRLELPVSRSNRFCPCRWTANASINCAFGNVAQKTHRRSLTAAP